MVVDVEELVESDKEIVEDKRTMIELKKIANTIYDCTMEHSQFITDCASETTRKENCHASVGSLGCVFI